MKVNRTIIAAAVAALAGTAQAQISDGVIKIGVMNDMSGLYADLPARARWWRRAWRWRTSARRRRA